MDVDSFWTHQLAVTDELCVLYVSALLLKNRTKKCTNCNGNIYGRFIALFQSCLRVSCLSDIKNVCSTHGIQQLRLLFVSIPDYLSRSNHFELIYDEKETYVQCLMNKITKERRNKERRKKGNME